MLRKNIKHNGAKKRVIAFAAIIAVTVAAAAGVFFIPRRANAWELTESAPYIVRPYPGRAAKYGMPTAYGDEYTVAGAAGAYTLKKNGAAAGGYYKMADLAAALNKDSAGAGADIRIYFDNVKSPFGDQFALTAAGNYVVEGSYIGDKSTVSADTGVFTVSNTAAGAQNVWFNDFYLENRGSNYRAASDSRLGVEAAVSGETYTAAKAGFGAYKPNGLYAAGASNVFIVGGSNVKASNGAYRDLYYNTLYNTQDMGYGSTSNAHNGIGAAGLGKTLSFSFYEIQSTWATARYHDHLESAKENLLRLAYWDEGINNYRDKLPADDVRYVKDAQAKYEFYTGKLLNAWVKSTRTLGAGTPVPNPTKDDFANGDFKDIYSYISSGTAGTNAVYVITIKQPSTGNAIRFNSSGSLVIDTAGEVSNYGDSGSYGYDAANSTVHLMNTNFTNGNGTDNQKPRLYVTGDNAKVVNYYFNVEYMRNYGQYTGAWASPSDSSQEIKLGNVFSQGGTVAANETPRDLLEGGIYAASGYISPYNVAAPAATINKNSVTNTPIVTVGKEDGTGPDMLAGVDANIETGSTAPGQRYASIKFINTRTSQSDNYMLSYSGGFLLNQGGVYMDNADGGKIKRSDLIFLGGDLTTFKNNAFSYGSSDGSAVRFAGGTWRTGGYPMKNTPFINNNSSGSNNTTSVNGSPMYFYGEGNKLMTANAGEISCGGITVSAAAGGSSTSYNVGLFGASGNGHSSADLMVFEGGTFINTDTTTDAQIIRVSSGSERNIYIKGGEFKSPAGRFIVMDGNSDVIMTGGSFENTEDVTVAPVLIGYNYVSVNTSGGGSYDPAGYSTLNADGKFTPSTKGSGGLGILYLNGGSIVSNNSSSSEGIVNVQKSNRTTALVMGLERQPRSSTAQGYNAAANGGKGNAAADGFLAGQKAEKVTTIVNKGTSPMIRVAPGYFSTTTTYINDGWGSSVSRTVKYLYHSNSKMAIDRVDFNYINFRNNVSSPSIAMAMNLPEKVYPVNFPELILTGTLSADGSEGTENSYGAPAGGVGKISGLVGRLQAGVNCVTLAKTFNGQGFDGKPYMLEITNLNEEKAVDGSIVRNTDGDSALGAFGYKNHFELYSGVSPVLTRTGSFPANPTFGFGGYGRAAIDFAKEIVDDEFGYYFYADDEFRAEGTRNDWVVQDTLSVNWYTQKGYEGAEPVAKYAAAISPDRGADGTNIKPNGAYGALREGFPVENVPAAFDPSVTGDPFRSLMYRVDSGVPSYYTYNDLLKNYTGDRFGSGEKSAGMPRLHQPGYVHIGWTYAGRISPYFSPSTSGVWRPGLGLIPWGRYYDSIASHAVKNELYNPNIIDPNVLPYIKIDYVFVNASDSLLSSGDHVITALWQLLTPDITPDWESAYTAPASAIVNNETPLPGVTYTYGPDKAVNLIAKASHAAEQFLALEYKYEWHFKAAGAAAWAKINDLRLNTDDINNISGIDGIRNARESGEYRLTLTAFDDTFPVKMQASSVYTFYVTVRPKPMTSNNIYMPAIEYDTNAHKPDLTCHDHGGIDAFHFYEINGTAKVILNGLVDGTNMADDGEYDFRVTPGLDARFSGVRDWPYYFTFFGNYTGSNIEAYFSIWGELTISFGNLKGAANPGMIQPDALMFDSGENLCYPELAGLTGVNGYTFLYWAYNGQEKKGAVENGGVLCDAITGNPLEDAQGFRLDGNGQRIKNPEISDIEFDAGNPNHWLRGAAPEYRLPGEFAHTLLAVWKIDAPVIVTKVNGAVSSTLDFTFDRTQHSITASAAVGSPAVSGVNYSYLWYVWEGTETSGNISGAAVSGTSSLSLMNYQPLTKYRLTVTAFDNGGLISESHAFVTAKVDRKAMGAGDIIITPQPYDGSPKTEFITITHNGHYLAAGTDYRIIQYPLGYFKSEDRTITNIFVAGSVYPDGMIDNGFYEFRFEFMGNYANAGGAVYISQYFEVYFDITISFGNLKPAASPAAAVKAPMNLTNTDTGYPNLGVPDMSNPLFKGYLFAGWEYNGVKITDEYGVSLGVPLQNFVNHTLRAVWTLIAPEAALKPVTFAGADDTQIDFTDIQDGIAISFAYDKSRHGVKAAASVDGLDAANSLFFTFAWKRAGAPAYSFEGETNYFLNVADSGTYILTVTAFDGTLTSYSREYVITVAISPFDISNADEVMVSMPTLSVAGGATVEPVVTIIHSGGVLQKNLDYTYKAYRCSATGQGDDPKGTETAEIVTKITEQGWYMLEVNGLNNYFKGMKQYFYVGVFAEIRFVTAFGIIPATISISGMTEYPELPAAPYGGSYPPPAGFTFKGWAWINGAGVYIMVKEGDPFTKTTQGASHNLTAVWEMNDIILSNETELRAGFEWVYTLLPQPITAHAFVDNGFGGDSGIDIMYQWFKQAGNEKIDILKVYNAGAAYYKLVITARHGAYEKAYIVDNILINILPRPINGLYGDGELISYTPDTFNVTNAAAKVAIDIRLTLTSDAYKLYGIGELKKNTEFTVAYIDKATGLPMAVTPESFGVGTHKFIVTGAGNFCGAIELEYAVSYNARIYFYAILPGVDNPASLIPEFDYNKGYYVMPAPEQLPLFGFEYNGYKFSHWAYTMGGAAVAAGSEVGGNIYLDAVWSMGDPQFINAYFDGTVISVTANSLTGAAVYTHNNDFYFGAALSHPFIDQSTGKPVMGVSVYYTWTFSPFGGAEGQPFAYSAPSYFARTVRESGVYKLSVIMKDGIGTTTAEQTFTFYITIEPREMGISDINITNPFYTGNVLEPVIEKIKDERPDGDSPRSYTLKEGTDYAVYVSSDYAFIDAGSYVISFVFGGNYKNRGGAAEIVWIYRIKPHTVLFENVDYITKPITGVYESTAKGLYPALPDLTGRLPGYTFLGWQYVGKDETANIIENETPLKEMGTHSLRARWAINAPVIGGAENISGVFKWTAFTSTATASLADWKPGVDFGVIYSWTNANGVIVSSGNTLSVADVAASGNYTLAVTVVDRLGVADGNRNTAIATKLVNVKIEPKELNAGNIEIKDAYYTGTGIKAVFIVRDGDNILEIEHDFKAVWGNKDVNEHKFIDVGKYDLKFLFSGNFKGAAVKNFTIKPSQSIVQKWWLWVIIAAAVIVIALILYAIYQYLLAKRKKYGMKRHMDSFMDTFDMHE